MIIAVYLSLVLAVALILVAVLGPSSRPAERHIQLPMEKARSARPDLRSVISRIFPFTHLLLEKLKLEGRLNNRLAAAHLKLSAAEFFNYKLILMLFLGAIGFFGFGRIALFALLAGLAFGYIIPDILLNKKIMQRKRIIAKRLPETVDLLGLCVEAGLDFTVAVKWVIEKNRVNPVLEELSFLLEEIKWGKSRAQALKDMATRLNVREVTSFVQILVQAERMGTPVAEAFGILSEDMRLQRFHEGERYAMKAPIKILLPLIFCILPVIAIIIGGPIFLQFTEGGLLKGIGG